MCLHVATDTQRADSSNSTVINTNVITFEFGQCIQKPCEITKDYTIKYEEFLKMQSKYA